MNGVGKIVDHVFAEETAKLVDEHHMVDDVAVQPWGSDDVAAPFLPHNLAVIDSCFSSIYEDLSVHLKTNGEIRCLFHSPMYLMPEYSK